MFTSSCQRLQQTITVCFLFADEELAHNRNSCFVGGWHVAYIHRCRVLIKMILGKDPKHVSQLDTILSLSLSLCLSPSLRLSLSLVLDLASILVSALVVVLVLVLARRPEAASGSHLEATVGNCSFS